MPPARKRLIPFELLLALAIAAVFVCSLILPPITG